jgi:hypothetical protein
MPPPGPQAPLRPDRPRRWRPGRPAHEHPRRGPAQQPPGHLVRRLVQRPSRLPRAARRSHLRAGGGGRQRQRGHGRGPHPGHRPDELATTDIADHALEALRASRVREVVVLGVGGRLRRPAPPPSSRSWGSWTGWAWSSTRPTSSSPGPAGPWSRRTARPGPTSRSCVSTRPGTRHGAQRRIVLRFLSSAGRARRAPRPHHRPAGRAQRAGRGRLGRAQVQGHGPVRPDRDRAGGPLDRLPDGADRGGAVRPGDLDRRGHGGRPVRPQGRP